MEILAFFSAAGFASFKSIGSGQNGGPKTAKIRSANPAARNSLPSQEEGALMNETPLSVATKFSMDAQAIVDLNKSVYPGLTKNSPLQKGTVLVLPE